LNIDGERRAREYAIKRRERLKKSIGFCEKCQSCLCICQGPLTDYGECFE